MFSRFAGLKLDLIIRAYIHFYVLLKLLLSRNGASQAQDEYLNIHSSNWASSFCPVFLQWQIIVCQNKS